MRILIAVIAFICCAYPFPGQAQTIECKCYSFDFDDFDLVFEGWVQSSRPVTEEEKQKLAAADFKLFRDDTRAYTFTVEHGWKGTEEGKTVEIIKEAQLLPRAGEDYFSPEKKAFLIAQKTAGFYITPVCWPCNVNDVMLDRFGLGTDFKVYGPDMRCKKDSECTAISTQCGDCHCDMPVLITALEKYRAVRQETCNKTDDQMSCDPQCDDKKVACRRNLCVFLPPNPASFE